MWIKTKYNGGELINLDHAVYINYEAETWHNDAVQFFVYATYSADEDSECRTIAVMDTRESAIALIEEIFNALDRGAKTFDVSKYHSAD